MFDKLKGLKGKKKENNESDKVSPGGSVIYEYQEIDRSEFRPLIGGVGEYAEEVCAYFQKIFPNRKISVLHEIISEVVHVDVNVMYPTEEEPNYLIFTTGMSDLPMTIPENIENAKELERGELVMILPAYWNFGKELSLTTSMPPEYQWPVNLIKYLARMPHEYKTWLSWGHTIPNGPDYEPIAPDSEMSCALLVGYNKGEYGSRIVAKDGTIINLYVVMMLSKAETEYKLENGMEPLLKLLFENEVGVQIDPNRKSCI